MNLYNLHYKNTVQKDLSSRFLYKNSNQIPKLEKLTINNGIKEFKLRKSLVNFLLIEFISGNSPKLTKVKKNISTLKLKKKFPNGFKINLQKNKAYEFFQKLGLYIFINSNLLIINTNNTLSISLKEIDSFQELTFFYNYFKNIKNIDINIKIKYLNKNNFELLFFLTSFKFPICFKKSNI